MTETDIILPKCMDTDLTEIGKGIFKNMYII